MARYRIGRVIAVRGGSIDVELSPYAQESDGTEYGVRDDMSIDFPGPTGPEPMLIGQPGTYIAVELTSDELLCVITDIRMAEAPASLGGATRDPDTVPVLGSARLLTALPVGTIDAKGTFERGTDTLPTIGSNVYAVPPSDVAAVYRSYRKATFQLGPLSLSPSTAGYVDFDVLVGRHCAVLGQTGAGKSWLVASLLQKVNARFNYATTMLIDWHGEYSSAFGQEATYLTAGQLEIPYWLMNFEELVDLCIDRGEREAPNQIAKFRECLQAAKEAEAKAEGLDLPKITLDTPVYFDFDEVIDMLRALDTEMVPSKSSQGVKQGPFHGQFTRMLARIESRLNDRRYDLIFKPTRYRSSSSLSDLIRELIGASDQPKKTVVLDISPIPFDVRPSVISLILRAVFEFSYWHRRAKGVEFPVLVVCDEAHAYLRDGDPAVASARLSAERIAKEGRKYGVGIMVVSQRPREVSSTILSQCSTFICTRITNPDDQSYVRGLLPDSMRGLIDALAVLRQGEALVLGDAVIMPTRMRIDPPSPRPRSQDVEFSALWQRPYVPPDVDAVIDEWRRQGIPRTTSATK